MVIAHPRYNGLRDDVGRLVKYEVGTNRVEVRKDKRVVLVNTDFICPRLFVRV
jgi:nicotinamide riboside kinase